MHRCFALLTALLILVGCAPAQPTAPTASSPLLGHTGGVEAVMQITNNTLTAEAMLTRTPQACTVTFTAPEALNGMTFTFHADAVDVDYHGLTYAFSPQLLPGSAVAGIVSDAIDKAVRSDVQTAMENGMPLLTGTVDAGAFQLVLDETDALPVKLLVPQQNLQIAFTSFQIST